MGAVEELEELEKLVFLLRGGSRDEEVEEFPPKRFVLGDHVLPYPALAEAKELQEALRTLPHEDSDVREEALAVSVIHDYREKPLQRSRYFLVFQFGEYQVAVVAV